MPLLIDILRHGDAVPSDPGGDAARPLSPAGVTRVRGLASRLVAAGWAPARIFTSPYRRAVETAHLMQAALVAPAAIEHLVELHPEADPEDTFGALRASGADGGHLLLVSHMPLVSRLCSYLSGRSIAFRTADLGRLECPGGVARGTARWRGFPAPED